MHDRPLLLPACLRALRSRAARELEVSDESVFDCICDNTCVGS